MRFAHTNVRVRDIDASLRFYEALGFEPAAGCSSTARTTSTSACRATATRSS